MGNAFFATALLQAATGLAPEATQPSHLLDALESAADGSALMVTWALETIGGSVAAVVSTSYLRPPSRRVRLIYLLYVPAWIFLGLSIQCGHLLSRRFIAAHFVAPAALQQIAGLMNDDYVYQQDCLGVGLALLGIWLIGYLIWWIFGGANGD